MKTSVTLELKTREAYQLFTRKIKDDRLFIEAVLHKLNKIAGQYKNRSRATEAAYHSTKQKLNKLEKQFESDTRKYQDLTQQHPILHNTTITVKAQFFPTIMIKNSLILAFIQLIQRYDALLSTIKMLHLAGCFETTPAYYANIRRVQTALNQTVGHILATAPII